MDLVTPGIGLLFWMTLSFGIVLFLLKKFAWKPILSGIKERETTIEESLNLAQKAKEEMKALQSNNEKLLIEARAERDNILKAGRDAKDAIIAEAKLKASSEADRIISQAQEAINNEKLAAITELKNQVASLSIDIAEKILRQELSADDKQKALVRNLLEDISLN